MNVLNLHLNGLTESEYLTGVSITGSSQFRVYFDSEQPTLRTIRFEIVDPIWNPESTITLSLTIETNENTYQTPLIINSTIVGD